VLFGPVLLIVGRVFWVVTSRWTWRQYGSSKRRTHKNRLHVRTDWRESMNYL